MEAITARQARRMVKKNLGEIERAEADPEIEAQLKFFEEKLQRAIIGKKFFFEIRFEEELYEETIETIIDRGFRIWKVYKFADKPQCEVSLFCDYRNEPEGCVCVSYKIYF